MVTRRTAIRTGLALIPAVMGLPYARSAAAQPVAPGPDRPELRALWVDAFHDGIKTPRQVDELVWWARAANVNALFVQVRRRGDAYYVQGLEPRTEDPDLQPGFDPLGYLLQRARLGPQPLQVHAWLATLAVWHKPEQPPLDAQHVFNQHGPDAAEHENWLSVRDDGEPWAGSTAYLDPGHPAAARYTADVYLDVLRRYDVDGIHLDHVRYFEGERADRRWGYNPTSVGRFNQRYGREAGIQPEPGDPQWVAWRRDQATALVRRIYLEAKALKPAAAVTAAVVTWGQGPSTRAEWERSAPFAAVFQDWRYWLQEGIVDYVMPMTYYRDQGQPGEGFDRWVRFQQEQRGRRAAVPGIAAYLNDPEGTIAQLQRARLTGAPGVALYSYASPVRAFDDERAARDQLLAALRQEFPVPVAVPALPQSGAGVGSMLVDVAGREGVTLEARGPGTFRALSDGTGLAGLVDVPPGSYDVVVSGAGVDPTPFSLQVHPGQVTTMRFGPGSR